MIVSGVYENGSIHLDKKIKVKKKTKVLVTFLDESDMPGKQRLKGEDFAFRTSRKKTKRYTGSLSDAVIEDRRMEI